MLYTYIVEHFFTLNQLKRNFPIHMTNQTTTT
jgi:hypothetical protein